MFNVSNPLSDQVNRPENTEQHRIDRIISIEVTMNEPMDIDQLQNIGIDNEGLNFGVKPIEAL